MVEWLDVTYTADYYNGVTDKWFWLAARRIAGAHVWPDGQTYVMVWNVGA